MKSEKLAEKSAQKIIRALCFVLSRSISLLLDHLLVVFTATAWHAAAAIAVVDSVTSFLVGSILAKAP